MIEQEIELIKNMKFKSTNIVEDKKTSFVSLSIDHVSPFLAQQWVELIINQIDKTIRNQDKQESIKSIDYLNRIAPTVNYEGNKKYPLFTARRTNENIDDG